MVHKKQKSNHLKTKVLNVVSKGLPEKRHIHTHHPVEKKEAEPEYMVQISDPKGLRKELLETLREIIIFMQGYEKFRKIQEEKIRTFAQLRLDAKDLNNLIENKLRRYFPKGKLKSTRIDIPPVELGDIEEKEEEEQPQLTPKYSSPTDSVPVAAPKPITRSEPKVIPSELDELEAQLKEVEEQLRNVQ